MKAPASIRRFFAYWAEGSGPRVVARFFERETSFQRIYSRFEFGLCWLLCVASIAGLCWFLNARSGEIVGSNTLRVSTFVWTELLWLGLIGGLAGFAGYPLDAAFKSVRRLWEARRSGQLGELFVSRIRAEEFADGTAWFTFQKGIVAVAVIAFFIFLAGFAYIVSPVNLKLIGGSFYESPVEAVRGQIAHLMLGVLWIGLSLLTFLPFLAYYTLRQSMRYEGIAFHLQLSLRLPVLTLYLYSFGLAAAFILAGPPIRVDQFTPIFVPNNVSMNWSFFFILEVPAGVMKVAYARMERTLAVVQIRRTEL